MDLDTLIISMYVKIDDELKIAQQRLHVGRLRQRGPTPRLADAEVLTMECAGEFLGLDCDTHVFAYFARHCSDLFPAPAQTHRTTFARQAANLWHLKELVWRRLAGEAAPADDRLHIVDSMPVPVCRFARAPFCRRLRGAARYGKDHADRQTFYGFRLHARLTWPGLLSEVILAPANQSEPSLLVPLADTAPASCAILGDRNYCGPVCSPAPVGGGRGLLLRAAAVQPDRQSGRSAHLGELPAGGAKSAGGGSGSGTGASEVIRHSDGIVANSYGATLWLFGQGKPASEEHCFATFPF